jgi:mycothiol synthase
VKLPDGYAARPVTRDDLPAVLALLDAYDVELVGEAEPMREQLEWLWGLSFTDLERDVAAVRHGDDLVAYADTMWDPGAGGPQGAMVRVHPAHRGCGLGAALAGWSEGRAAERGAAGIRQDVLAADAAAAELLSSRGYAHVRTSWTMGRPLAGGEVAGAPPRGVAIRPFASGDERTLFEVHEGSFADHWGFLPGSFDSFMQMWFHAADTDPSLMFLAELDGAAVGHLGALINDIGGYVYALGVLPAARGRGIAQALLGRIFAELAARGQRDVSLGVDAGNPTGAVALYRKVGMDVRREFHQWDLGTEAVAGVPGSGSH